MVNVEVYCPPCDHFNQCPCKGKFIGVVEERRLYTNPVPYIRCPTLGRKIYLNHPSRYKILRAERYEPQEETEQKVTRAHTSKRGKWARKAHRDMTKRIKRGEDDPKRRYGKKKK